MGKGDEKSALQVIILGSGGGPLENNTTALLVRSVANGWKKGSVLAVDAGVHLAAISKLLKKHKSEYYDEAIQLPVTLSDGPFEGLKLHHRNAKANAASVTRDLVETCLLTHAHLDHISGFVINTASRPGARPKRLAGLPRTIEAIKTHIFNNIIWPNLSDENNGAGLVTYMRLVEGGSPALGDGEGKGYTELCDGLGVKTFGVSHGHCIEKHSHRGSSAGLISPLKENYESPHLVSRSRSSLASPRRARKSSTASIQGSFDLHRTSSNESSLCVYDSSAFFIRDTVTGTEVLIFGDIEADSLSLSPRNKFVWSEAAPKITTGSLTGIFIECSYDNSQSTDRLFGHLTPGLLFEELTALAGEVEEAWERQGSDRLSKKRKRLIHTSPDYRDPNFPRRQHPVRAGSISPKTSAIPDVLVRVTGADEFPELDGSGKGNENENESRHEYGNGSDKESPVSLRLKENFPLKGLKVVIIHMKDKLDDGPHVGETILEQLLEYEKEAKLGCEFIISRVGMSIYL